MAEQGSHHVAAFSSAAQVTLEMGRANTAMLFSNYRTLVKPKGAAAYWRIGLPDKQE